jgi:hypothetical protein
MSKKESTEHELIKARQRRISLPFADAKPSEVTEVYWIYAIRKKEDYPKPTTRSGKWLIFIDKKARRAARSASSLKFMVAKTVSPRDKTLDLSRSNVSAKECSLITCAIPFLLN